MSAASTFKDQTVVVTGGGTGIGLAIARRLGEPGARLVLASRSAGHLEPAAESLRAAGVPVGRWGRPEEVADAVAYLASPMAGYVTGEVLTIDGGASIGGSRCGFFSSR